MSIKPSSFMDYFFQIQKKYEELRNLYNNQEYFRIINIKHNSQNECTIVIQIVGKATFFETTPQEIVANDKLIEGFSKKDIRTITYFATQEIKKPTFKILVQEFNDNLNKMTFKIGKRGSSQAIEKTASEITLDKPLLNQLTPEDALKVGYAIASEQHLKEREYIYTNK